MGDWRDFEEGRIGFSVAQLADGESIDVYVDDSPYLKEETIEHENAPNETSQSLRIPNVPIDVPDGFVDMNDEEVNTETDATEVNEESPQYDLINSSAAFKRAMREEFPDGVSPVNAVVTITAHQSDPDDNFTRTYSIED